jgi:NAD(P)-binding Rossmann-like domain
VYLGIYIRTLYPHTVTVTVITHQSSFHHQLSRLLSSSKLRHYVDDSPDACHAVNLMEKISKLIGTLSLLLLWTLSAMSSGPRVAIVGGGISGLSCARRLQTLGIDATVFDTGKKATGGRCSSRILQVDGQTHVVDHSSQFFTATSESFKEDLENFKRDGSIIEWKGKLAQISETKPGATELNLEKTRFVGKNGMASLSKKMSENLDIKKQTWVRNVIRPC